MEAFGTQARREGAALRAMIDVLEADDIILTKVASRLYLDEFERNFSAVCEAVHHPDRDVRRLVFINEASAVADRHLGRAAHDNPVFGAMHVLLQRELTARLHHDSLD